MTQIKNNTARDGRIRTSGMEGAYPRNDGLGHQATCGTTKKFTTRFAGDTEEKKREKTEMYEISSNLRFRIISYMVLLEKERRKTPHSLPNRTSMEREAVEDWISF